MNGKNRIMKKSGMILCFLVLLVSTLFSQRLEIHHINVNNGDATVIAVIDKKDNVVVKVLIDGGQKDAQYFLLPYFNNVFGNTNFNRIILTHYHNDHYGGLLALEDGRIKGEYLVDPGGYDLNQVEPKCDKEKLSKIQPKDSKAGWKIPRYTKAIKTAALNYKLERWQGMNPESGKESSMIGEAILLAKVNNIEIRLRCVTYWGYVLSNTNTGYKDVWTKTGDKSANNATIAFVLECGQFRYFLGGDMGGENTTSYIDIETPLSKGFVKSYPKAKSFNPEDKTEYNGHMCGFKASHHGSDKSNNSTILDTMKPAVCVTSAGDNKGWHLPSVGFIQRLKKTRPLSIIKKPPFASSLQGLYFTNLNNFGGKNNSRDEADKLFKNNKKRINYDYGAKGYFIIVYLNENILSESTFTAYKVKQKDGKSYFLTYYRCHKKCK